MRRLIVMGLGGLALCLGGSAPDRHAAFTTRAFAAARLPDVFVWAWERSEDLSFLDPRRIGVAYLARTVRLRGDDVLTRPRMQRLRVPDGAIMLAVVRVEADRAHPPSYSETLERALVDTIAVDAKPRIAGIQIDFDAALSERRFYREMLIALRQRLPATRLSITALASWCTHDTWLAGMPIDEAVPMLFRMGVDDRRIRAHVDAGRDFRPDVCRRAVGVSTDETIPTRSWSDRRVYVFHPRPWSSDSVTAALRQLGMDP